MRNTIITVTTAVDGLHHWPDAPNKVDFLRSPHRHIFKIAASFSLTASRQLEFFITQDQLLQAILPCGKMLGDLSVVVIDFGQQSCEQIADAVMTQLDAMSLPVVSVMVSEDGENSATVTNE